jgi:Mlc titration factor MtfA (ptsG expression regulator)
MEGIFIVGVVLLLIAWVALEPQIAARRRRRLQQLPFPPAWRQVLDTRVLYVRRLPADLQHELLRQVRVFVTEKNFVGCGGLAIDDEIRVTIAAQACLLTLRRPGACFPGVRDILVYPGGFLVEHTETDEAGVQHHRREARSGESWSYGQVVLSWDDAREGAAHDADGHNVVLHEFAHQLDQYEGFANGAPWLPAADRARWRAVLGAEFARLRNESALHRATFLDPYGAAAPAEFFAVCTEVFFEQPAEMAEAHPDLYREFARFYRLDPQSW